MSKSVLISKPNHCNTKFSADVKQITRLKWKRTMWNNWCELHWCNTSKWIIKINNWWGRYSVVSIWSLVCLVCVFVDKEGSFFFYFFTVFLFLIIEFWHFERLGFKWCSLFGLSVCLMFFHLTVVVCVCVCLYWIRYNAHIKLVCHIKKKVLVVIVVAVAIFDFHLPHGNWPDWS